MTVDPEVYRLYRDFSSPWARHSIDVIRGVHEALPPEVSLADRMKAVDDAYPFGQRRYHPYKQWLRVRLAYLSQYGYESRGNAKVGQTRMEFPSSAPVAESPLERQKRRSGAITQRATDSTTRSK